MKLKDLLFVLILPSFLLMGCAAELSIPDDREWKGDMKELYETNDARITISEGFAGTLTLKEGNCMPIIDPENTTCKEYPVRRKIRIYEYTKYDQMKQILPRFYQPYTKWITSVQSDENGFFQIKLSAGTYSCFIEENGMLYANSLDGDGGVCSFTVSPGSVTKRSIWIDYAVY